MGGYGSRLKSQTNKKVTVIFYTFGALSFSTTIIHAAHLLPLRVCLISAVQVRQWDCRQCIALRGGALRDAKSLMYGRLPRGCPARSKFLFQAVYVMVGRADMKLGVMGRHLNLFFFEQHRCVVGGVYCRAAFISYRPSTA